MPSQNVPCVSETELTVSPMPGTRENHIKKLQGAKLNVKTQEDNTYSHQRFPGLSFAKLDQVDLDQILQTLREDGRHVPADPLKNTNGTEREITCQSVFKVTKMNRNGNGCAKKHTDPQDSAQGREIEEWRHHFFPVKSGKCEQTTPTHIEAKQESDQHREKVQLQSKLKQHKKIYQELAKHRPTKSVCGNQPAAEETAVLYGGEVSHRQPIHALPADVDSKECVLLTVSLRSPGVVAGSSHGRGQDWNLDVYNTLVAWLLSLVDPGGPCDEDEAGVAAPFRVEGLQQVWRKDGFGLQVLVSPQQHCDTSERGNREKSPPSFYQRVCQFLSQTPLSVIAHWLPELKSLLDQQACDSTIHLPSLCLSSFISAAPKTKAVDMTLGLSPGFYWQTLGTQECVCQSRETMVTPELHTEVALALGSTAFFLHPLVSHYTLQCLLDLGLDVCGLRLLYPPRWFLSSAPDGKVFNLSDDEGCQPVVALAVRGPHAHSALQNLTRSSDALLDRKQHLRVVYSYHQASRVHRELCVWFAGRLPGECAQNQNQPLNRVAPSEDRISSSANDLSSSSAFLCATTQADILLVVSPVVAPRCYGRVLAVCERRGFSLRGLQRLQIHSQEAKVLRLTKQQARVFCSPPAAQLNQQELHSSCLVLLLRRENILRHSVRLPAALIRELETQGRLGCIGSMSHDVPSMEPSCCFHTVPYSSDMFSTFVRGMWEVPDPSRVVLLRLTCEAEAQQVVILTLCGTNMSRRLSLLHRALTGGSDGAGFELLSLKWLPALTQVQAQELSPYEVGEPLWRGSLHTLMSHPVLACQLRKVDAFASVRQLRPQHDPGDLSVLVSPTPEAAFRQASVLFVQPR
ncbi:dynein axonemal assembly factor 8 isoform X2 [Genypterus blacodes]|uniref:dynein axonemal assembly factor 8 isoform X2 n=1 Tax=Genypterus blacodes TaxID=154954 RepID=UPI003F75CF12